MKKNFEKFNAIYEKLAKVMPRKLAFKVAAAIA